MSPASARSSSPVRNTRAASASDARCGGAFSAATQISSHNRRTVGASCPCPASQSPKLTSSVAGSSGSTVRSAAAARIAASRCPYPQRPVVDQSRQQVRRRGQSPGTGQQVRRYADPQDRDREGVLQVRPGAGAEPGEQFPVFVVAAEEDVLAGVHHEVAPAERVGGPTQFRSGLEQGDLCSGVDQTQCRRDAGQAAPDDADLFAVHALLRVIARAATYAFCQPGRDTRRRVTASGSATIRASSRW